MALSNAVELMNPFIGSHHKRVAFIAYSLGDMLSLTKDDFNNLILASLLHDIGAVSIAEWSHLLKFETNKPYRHSEIGYYFFKDTGLDTRVVTDEEAEELVSTLKPQPNPTVRKRIIPKTWKWMGYSAEKHLAERGDLQEWMAIEDASDIEGNLFICVFRYLNTQI